MSVLGNDDGFAIVGLAVRLPGKQTDATTYWQKLRNGVCSIRKQDKEALENAGVPPHLLANPDYVPFAAPLDDFDHFDAEFFGLSPKDAAIMDPQHRQMLELSWEALEQAGHPPSVFEGKIGVYAGCGMGSYFYFNVCSNPDLVNETGMFLLRHTGNDKDFLSTRVSHAFDLKGPSVNIQTACSTSLVAVHYAVQALRAGDCDMALAGGSTIELPQGQGYLFKENEILSPDGQCRAFDHRAQGTVFGSGAGVVALRRLQDAIDDGDPILAVIKGSAINNDGADKAGYLAPSVSGQAEAIAAAHVAAGVTADTIDYVECHGTGTYLGDPIEVAALTEAFQQTTDAEGFCRIGSVKTNIGHLDTAAGIASLGKAALAIHHGEIPPTLGYEAPNPAIDFETSPFKVNDQLTPWPKRAHPRRAGVNSLGVGGTNAHVVLEEAPERLPSEDSDWPFQLLTLSARSDAALDAACNRLADHLEANPDQSLADVAFTLKEGRHAFEKRRVMVAETHAEAATLLRERPQYRTFSQSPVGDTPDTVFMFPGGGAQYAGMARNLYDSEPVFRDWIDRGLAILEPKLDYDVRAIWLPDPDAMEAANERLKTPSVQLPLILIVEYALAQLWMSWDVKPAALIGHSMGENTAACVAGVMSFEDAIGLVHLRGTLFDTVPAGGMLSVALPEAELRDHLSEDLDIASVNAPGLTVATGPDTALKALEQSLNAADIDCSRIAINIAAHSRMLDPILDDFRAYLASITLQAPAIPFVSNTTGTWITEAQATDPDYWVAHLRGVVRFADGIKTLAEQQNRIFLEVGPGRAMVALAAQNERVTRARTLSSLRDPGDDVADDAYFVTMLGRYWAMGGQFDWTQLWEGAQRRRVALPSYPFQHKRYFIEPGTAAGTETAASWLMRIEDPAHWGWKPFWKPTYADCRLDVLQDLASTTPETWLIFADDVGLADALIPRLKAAGHRIITVHPGAAFERTGDEAYRVAPALMHQLIDDLDARDIRPSRALHLWLVTGNARKQTPRLAQEMHDRGFWTLFHLAQAWPANGDAPLRLNVITSGATSVAGEALPFPIKATVMGPARVIPREFPDITCAVLDIAPPTRRSLPDLVAPVLEEVFAEPGTLTASLRGPRRYEQTWQPASLETDTPLRIEKNAVILMTGGLGGIGMTLAEQLVRDYDARIAFVSRQALPARNTWDETLRTRAPNTRMARQIRALMALEAAGGRFKVLAADVANHKAMAQVIDTVTADWGPVSGVIHAAGAIDDAPILTKTAQSIDAVLSAKIQGTKVLLDLFPDGTLDWVALFSSISTITAPAGQVDYVAANEYLNAIAQASQSGRTRIVAIDWGVWAEVGMAARALDSSDTETADMTPLDQPLLDGRITEVSGDHTYVAHWRAKDLWVLDGHRTKAGDALLPGTGYLELAAQVLAAEGKDSAFELRDLTFLSPLRVDDARDTEVRITLTASPNGYKMEVASSQDGRSFEPNAEAILQILPMIAPAPLDLAAIAARCPKHKTAAKGETLITAQEAHLDFGPHWRVLEETRLGEGEGLARLRVQNKDPAYILNPGLMDIATGWAMALIKDYDPAQLWVPVSYRSAQFFGPIPNEVHSWIRHVPSQAAGGATARFDITLAAPDGVVFAEIKGFSIHRLATAAPFAAAGTTRAARPQGDRPLSPAEERLYHNISQGIRPADGAQAFFTALALGTPQIAVSSLDLPGLITQTDKDAAPRSGSGQTFERPDLDSDYVAPEGEVEERLAEFWTDLLGVARIGADDNFFDLGGHSLIAVRLFAMVKSAYSVDFPISVLFEAPTIRTCAALITRQTGFSGASGDTPGAAAGSPPVVATRKYLHVVPLSDTSGKGTPLFMVAGMYGNVMHMRHLAQLLGKDRPVYGLQLRGVFGDYEPHHRLEDAAADYIAEIRDVCPQGPYLIGGYSGGAVTSLEMAHQLEAAHQEVGAVLLLDIPQPKMTRDHKIRLHLTRLKKERLSYMIGWLRRKLSTRRQLEQEAEEQNLALGQAFMASVDRYVPRVWSGNVALFRPPLEKVWELAPDVWADSDHKYVRTDNLWGDHLPNLNIVEVPGDHVSMVLEPNVRSLADAMKTVLDKAEEESRPKPRWSQKAAE